MANSHRQTGCSAGSQVFSVEGGGEEGGGWSKHSLNSSKSGKISKIPNLIRPEKMGAKFYKMPYGQSDKAP